jgi:hypothetical protein
VGAALPGCAAAAGVAAGVTSGARVPTGTAGTTAGTDGVSWPTPGAMVGGAAAKGGFAAAASKEPRLLAPLPPPSTPVEAGDITVPGGYVGE